MWAATQVAVWGVFTNQRGVWDYTSGVGIMRNEFSIDGFMRAEDNSGGGVKE